MLPVSRRDGRPPAGHRQGPAAPKPADAVPSSRLMDGEGRESRGSTPKSTVCSDSSPRVGLNETHEAGRAAEGSSEDGDRRHLREIASNGGDAGVEQVVELPQVKAAAGADGLTPGAPAP